MVDGTCPPGEADRIAGERRAARRLSFVFGIPAILLVYFGGVAAGVGPRPSGPRKPPDWALFYKIQAGAGVLLVAGLAHAARSRGRSGWWGLLGLGHLAGLIALVFLPSRCGWCDATWSRGRKACAGCGAPL